MLRGKTRAPLNGHISGKFMLLWGFTDFSRVPGALTILDWYQSLNPFFPQSQLRVVDTLNAQPLCPAVPLTVSGPLSNPSCGLGVPGSLHSPSKPRV